MSSIAGNATHEPDRPVAEQPSELEDRSSSAAVARVSFARGRIGSAGSSSSSGPLGVVFGEVG
jgi:hypothetical protein